jgi:hypothetical protein
VNGPIRVPTGHVFRVDRKRGPVWYAKYRLPDGRQVQRKVGPAWTERGRPPAGYFTKRTAEAWLRDTLDAARRRALPGQVATGATFADAAAEWLRYVEHDRDRKPSTLRDYRNVVSSRLLPAFGAMRLEDISTELVERWRANLGADREKPLTNRTRNKSLTILGAVMDRACKVYGLPANPVRGVEKLRERCDTTRFAFYSPEEVHALVRAAASEQDRARSRHRRGRVSATPTWPRSRSAAAGSSTGSTRPGSSRPPRCGARLRARPRWGQGPALRRVRPHRPPRQERAEVPPLRRLPRLVVAALSRGRGRRQSVGRVRLPG